jgi:Uma2 family endonuclease
MRVVTSAHRVRYTYAQYLALEKASNVKHEYLDGQIYEMAGGTPQHAALAAAVVGLLFPALRDRGGRTHSADLRVRVRATGLATYPDVTVVCGPRECDPDDDDAVNNPTMIVEVLSPSTEEYDRGEKFDHYKRIESLREYVLIAQDRREVEVWTRGAEGSWGHRRFADGDAAALDSVGAVLDVAALYGAVA